MSHYLIKSYGYLCLTVLFMTVTVVNSEHKIRLRGGEHPFAGQLQLLIDDQWHVVCSDGWTFENAEVACRELGYNNGAVMYMESISIPPGLEEEPFPFIENDFTCRGNELHLGDCPYEQAKVRCGESSSSVRGEVGVRCNFPGYVGCFELMDGTVSRPTFARCNDIPFDRITPNDAGVEGDVDEGESADDVAAGGGGGGGGDNDSDDFEEEGDASDIAMSYDTSYNDNNDITTSTADSFELCQDVTIDSCLEFCGARHYAALSKGSKCTCWDTNHFRTMTESWRQLTPGYCNSPCHGDLTKRTFCGGTEDIASVYKRTMGGYFSESQEGFLSWPVVPGGPPENSTGSWQIVMPDVLQKGVRLTFVMIDLRQEDQLEIIKYDDDVTTVVDQSWEGSQKDWDTNRLTVRMAQQQRHPRSTRDSSFFFIRYVGVAKCKPPEIQEDFKPRVHIYFEGDIITLDRLCDAMYVMKVCNEDSKWTTLTSCSVTKPTEMASTTKLGYEGDTTARTGSTSAGTIAGAVTAVFLVIVIIITLVIIYLFRRGKIGKDKSPRSKDDKAIDQTRDDNPVYSPTETSEYAEIGVKPLAMEESVKYYDIGENPTFANNLESDGQDNPTSLQNGVYDNTIKSPGPNISSPDVTSGPEYHVLEPQAQSDVTDEKVNSGTPGANTCTGTGQKVEYHVLEQTVDDDTDDVDEGGNAAPKYYVLERDESTDEPPRSNSETNGSNKYSYNVHMNDLNDGPKYFVLEKTSAASEEEENGRRDLSVAASNSTEPEYNVLDNESANEDSVRREHDQSAEYEEIPNKTGEGFVHNIAYESNGDWK
ncbi:uncharacterized protein LOC144445265 [Glandiceps talaboti]